MIYQCSKCKCDKEETLFPPSLLKKAITTKKNYIPRCKECSKTYADNYIKSIKTKGLTRNQKKLSIMAKAVNGTLYVIGPDIPNTPYKIGITSGYDTSKRKTAIQTNHWMEMKEIWKSDIMDRVDIMEKKLHNYFKDKRVRGEWFNISKKDIDNLPSIINQLK